jgi:Subtilisin-like serine proteases
MPGRNLPRSFPGCRSVRDRGDGDRRRRQAVHRANRGKYISVAAPGVDILVPAPEGEYQITTGTSVAAAEVSGIVALLLERNPKLTPADIRRILTASAKRLAPGERDDNFGSGLIDPLQALQLADPRIATTTPPRRR